ncbi:MAG: hypothetical protein LAO08_19445 [Acidobacteriia bacterium]|nr:hypothetical protein [Terriglobia bacterium]
MCRHTKRFLWFVVLAWIAATLFSGEAFAQGSRKDDIVFNAQGRPMAGASVRVCTSTATGQPCSPLALIYSDAALTQALANPLSADGLGNYSFYAAPGRYEIEISGPGIITKQLPNVILPSDPSTPTFTTVTTTSGISAFSLSLTGNLTVSGSASVAGTLTVGGAPVPSATGDNQWSQSQRFKGPIPWRDFTAYMPAGGCSSTATDPGANTTGTINGGSATLLLAGASDFKNGCGIAVLHAGPVATLNTPPSAISISSISRSGSPTVTVVSSGSHGLVVGSGTGMNQGVQVSGCSISAYNGTFPIQTVVDSTHFTYTSGGSATDSPTGCTVTTSFGYAHGTGGSSTYHYKIVAVDSNMGTSAASTTPVTVTAANATLTKYNYNHVMWPLVTGAYEYVIYSDQGLGGAYSCVGTAFTNGYSDRGLPMPCPVFAPATPPASAGAQTLNTTIVNGGGSTTLTLAATATSPVTSQNVYHDESSFLASCVSDVVAFQSIPANNPGNEYGCYVPAGTWWFNGMLPTATVSNTNQSVGIYVAGKTIFHTIPWFITKPGYSVKGMGGGPGPQSFQSKIGVGMQVAPSVAAAVVINASPAEFSGFSLGTLFGHGIYVVGGAAVTLDNDTIAEQTTGSAGAPVVADSGILGLHMNNDSLYAEAVNGGLASILFSVTPYSGASVCCVYINNLITYNHGIEVSGPGGNGTAGGGMNSFFFSNWLQENLAPSDNGDITMDAGPNAPGAPSSFEALSDIRIDNLNDSDTSGNSVFVFSGFGTGSLNGVTLFNIAGPQIVAQCVNGSVVCNSDSINIPGYFSAGGPPLPGRFASGGSGLEIQGGTPGANVSRAPLQFVDVSRGGRSAAWGQLLPPVTTFSVQSTGSGSLPAANYCAQVDAVDARGQKTLPTPIVCQAVGASSSIVWQWFESAFYTSSSYDFYYCNTGPNCTPNTVITGITGVGTPASYTLTSAIGSAGSANTQAKAYLSWMAWDYDDPFPSCFYCTTSHSDEYPIGFGMVPASNVGLNIFTKLGIRVGTQYQASEGSAPSGVAGVDLLYADSTAHRWKMINNNGTAALVGGIGGTLVNGNAVKADANLNLVDAGGPPALAGSTACAYQGPASAVQGTGAAAVYYTCTIPAGALAAGAGVRFTVTSQHTTGTASVSYNLSFGGTTTTAAAPSGAANQLEVITFTVHNAAGVQNSQNIVTVGQDSAGGTNSIKYNTAAVNTANAVVVNVQFNVAATDFITPLSFVTELLAP